MLAPPLKTILESGLSNSSGALLSLNHQAMDLIRTSN